MADTVEVALTSDSSNQLWNACVWDPRTGTTLMTYKGGSATPHTLCLLGNDFLLAAEPNKPILRSWTLNKHEQTQLRMVCPGVVSALACTRDGQFCAAGIADVLYVWQTCTGFLLASVKGHYQNISCLKFTDDGAYVVTGGEEGQVLVWNMDSLLAKDANISGDQVEGAVPKYKFSSHCLSVRDIVVDYGGIQSLLASVSLDKKCKIYSLVSGHELLTLVFSVGLTSVAFNSVSTEVFIGASNGSIFSYNLQTAPRTPEFHIPPEYASVFTGHTKAVTCISVSVDNKLLISGSLDQNAIIWDISSKQKLRTLSHKGSVTNVFFTIAPKNVFSEDLKPSIILKSFLRHANTEDNKVTEKLCIGTATKNKESEELDKILDLQSMGGLPQIGKSRDTHQNKHDVEKLQKINHDLYTFAMTELLKPTATEISQHDKMLQLNSNNSPSKTNEKLTETNDSPSKEKDHTIKTNGSPRKKQKKRRSVVT